MKSDHYTRRDFMTLLGMGSAALAVSGPNLSEKRKSDASLGFQLYTVRKQIETDLVGTIRKIAGMGYVGVETYWSKTAGISPAKVVADFGKRAPFLHIKDGPAIKGEKAYDQVPAGQLHVPEVEGSGKKGSSIHNKREQRGHRESPVHWRYRQYQHIGQ